MRTAGGFCSEGAILNKRRLQQLVFWLGITLIVLLRVGWLDSDAYARLSWSSALLTDEGFYIHNARNVALFGNSRTDAFNNMLIMPVLHLVQVGVFQCFGVGAIQARLISIVSSLLTLWIVYCLLRRLFGEAFAQAGVLLLGLDHVFLLYNRLALMDTPALLPATGALYAFVRSAECAESRDKAEKNTRAAGQVELRLSESEVLHSRDKTILRKEAAWMILSGLLLLTAYGVRGLAALIIPGAYIAWWFCFPRRRRSLGYLSLGLLTGSFLYFFSWYWPHHRELSQVNRYYIGVQLLPHSVAQLRANVLVALFHWERGEFPFLLKHSPVLFFLALVACYPRPISQTERETRPTNALLIALQWSRFWFIITLIFCALVNYAPSRYFVLFYPPMLLLALSTLSQWGKTKDAANNFWSRRIILTLAVFVVVNVGWLADWCLHLTYRQQEADHWLAVNLPANSVLFGAVAPGLCLNNGFRVVNVMEGFCNDQHPLERFPEAPRYILMLDRSAHNSIWRERWWDRHYPGLVAPERRIHAFPRLLRAFFVVGVYDASPRNVNSKIPGSLR